MKISPNLNAFNISAKGMSIQKRKMDVIAENIANSDTTKTKEGIPYQRKFLVTKNQESFAAGINGEMQNNLTLKMSRNNSAHLQPAKFSGPVNNSLVNKNNGITSSVEIDSSQGNIIYSPDHPDANEEGYIELPNVNVVNEMVEMIAATRSYEANLTAFNSSKQMAKDSLDI